MNPKAKDLKVFNKNANNFMYFLYNLVITFKISIKMENLIR